MQRRAGRWVKIVNFVMHGTGKGEQMSNLKRLSLYGAAWLTLVIWSATSSLADLDNNWDNRFFVPGVNGTVHAVAVVGSDVYIGGDFLTVNNVEIKGIARWDGTNWSSVGGGVRGTVSSFVVAGSDLYVGGSFDRAGSITARSVAKWDGSSWSALGNAVTGGGIHAMAMVGSDLYVGGNIWSVDNSGVSNIAKWNGSSWSDVGGGVNNEIFTMAASGSDLYIGGRFTTAGGNPAARIARWNGTAWSDVGGGTDSDVYSVAVSGSDLYATGAFNTPAAKIARWDGSAWSGVGSGLDNYGRALFVDGGDLYVGGDFNSAGGVSVLHVAKWNGSTWSALASGRAFAPIGFAKLGATLYVAGRFGQWDGSTWSDLGVDPSGRGLIGAIKAMATIGNDVFVASDGLITNDIWYLAKWDGSDWSPLGTGVNGPVWTLTTDGTNLYAGGNFVTAGGSPANRVARWDGSAWSTLGAGIDDGSAYVLASDSTNLYVGGDFTSVAGVSANHIAKWNGSTWSALGAGITSSTDVEVLALELVGSDLYAGGRFTTAGGLIVNSIAKWNGSAWSALGAGVAGSDPAVFALDSDGTNLFVGGAFQLAGGTPAAKVARWNGTSWASVGTGGPSGDVKALQVTATHVYAAGTFGAPFNNIAHWDGRAWSTLGSGTNDAGTIEALTRIGRDLFVGGGFRLAGNKPSNQFGIYEVVECGDGYVHPGVEACDDMNTINGDGCDNNCTASACGNGELAPGEACDDGNLILADGCDNDCQPSTCGNGFAAYGRQCDGTSSNGASCIDECDSGWSSNFDTGVENPFTLGSFKGELIAAGEFNVGDGAATNGIAHWNGHQWSGFGNGIQGEGEVNAVASTSTHLYIGGLFQNVDGAAAENVARWNGSAWSALGSGTDSPVHALLADGSDLYAGGEFNNAGGNPANFIATWNGSTWFPLGAGVDNVVTTMAKIGDDLYVGGEFLNAGGAPANYVASWDGSSWTALAGGLPTPPNELAALGDDLYAVGANYVLKWDGLSWSALGVIAGDVRTITVIDDTIYIGGAFTDVSGTRVANVAKWNGSSWLSLASGTNGDVSVLATNGATLFVGGTFSAVGGGKSSIGIAMWQDTGCGEVCDDGNATEGDGCDSNCTTSGCGNGIQAPGESCDDGNETNGDACDNNCTVPGCGNGIASPATGEMCDDGNMTNGDGCESNCKITPVNVMVGAGATVSTDDGSGATPEIPVQTSVTTASGGTVSISAPASAPQDPEGIKVLGAQLQIDAPPATANDPLIITLTVEGSLIPSGVDPSRLEMTRDGAPILDCTGAAGTASPDPCIVSRELLADGDVRITTATSHASLWGIGVRGLSAEEQKCVNAMNGAGVKVAKTQAKAIGNCLKAAAAGSESDAQSCMTADPKGKLDKVMGKTQEVSLGKCTAGAPFGLSSATIVNQSAAPGALAIPEILFGDDLTSAVIPSASDSAGAACQATALKGTQKLFDTAAKLFLKCKKNGLAGKTTFFLSAAQLASCFDQLATDPAAKIAGTITKLADKLAAKCAGVSMTTALPGDCGAAANVAQCIAKRVNCRLCRMFNAMDGLSGNCDHFDDGAINGSCE